jgi:uncharacterized membrane protein YwzB
MYYKITLEALFISLVITLPSLLNKEDYALVRSLFIFLSVLIAMVFVKYVVFYLAEHKNIRFFKEVKKWVE